MAEEMPLVERLDPALEAVEVFRLLSDLPHVVFFDSALRHPHLGRYSFVAADPVEWFTFSADGSNAFGRLADRIGELRQARRAELPPFQGGWAGLFGYELAGSLERVPRASIDEFAIPALAVGLYDIVVAFDHDCGAAWLISQGFPEWDESSRRERAAERLLQFRRRLTTGPRTLRGGDRGSGLQAAKAPSACPLSEGEGVKRLSMDELAPQFGVDGRAGISSNFSADGYHRAVQRVIDYIYSGDVFQVNLSQRLLHAADSSSVDLYCRLRERNPAPFAGYLDGGEWQIASASPERFIRVDNGHVETRPIKGTRGRSPHPVADLFAGDDLRASEKDWAENVMIVDLLRNDLSRTCQPDSVRVSQLCGLEMYEYVQHLVSVVEGRLRPECTPLDVLQTSFPGGSVTGAPKI
ncbi:MAG TPA: anthranilate synthase component I family protein, partial [Lacipirellulaceae bacterium]|nr:anthranilate synthase component I family protein [Lacipirellulaceae bacterium]